MAPGATGPRDAEDGAVVPIIGLCRRTGWEEEELLLLPVNPVTPPQGSGVTSTTSDGCGHGRARRGPRTLLGGLRQAVCGQAPSTAHAGAAPRPSSPTAGSPPKGKENRDWKGHSHPVLTAAPFTVAREGDHRPHPPPPAPAGEWIKKE